MGTQEIGRKIEEARQEVARLSTELSTIDETMRNDSIDFGLQRAGVAEGRSPDRSISEILSAERDRMRELRDRREELPYLIHAARAHELRLEVKRYELQEAEAQERLLEASKQAEPLRKELEALQTKLKEAEEPVSREAANIQMAQGAASRKQDELDAHMSTAVRRLPEFVPANTRV